MVEKDDLPLEGRERIWYIAPILVAVILGSLWLTQPSLIYQAEAELRNFQSDGALSAVGDSQQPSELYFDSDDLSFMNRLFIQLDSETAYCGDVSDSGAVDIWKADTVNASRTDLFFTTSNCPESYKDMMVHTQPDTLEFSDTDFKTLKESDFNYSCVHHGILPTSSGSEIGSLRCFEKAGDANSYKTEKVVAYVK